VVAGVYCGIGMALIAASRVYWKKDWCSLLGIIS
jgi:hypothetical protein